MSNMLSHCLFACLNYGSTQMYKLHMCSIIFPNLINDRKDSLNKIYYMRS